jgi:hypothetical protein
VIVSLVTPHVLWCSAEVFDLLRRIRPLSQW